MLQSLQDPGKADRQGQLSRLVHTGGSSPAPHSISHHPPCVPPEETCTDQVGRLADGQVHVHVRQAGTKKDIDP